MTEWESAKHFIYAKKDIDSMMYIDENLFKIPMPLRKEYVDRIRDHFYINCCVVVDAFLDKNKIENSKEHKYRTEWKEHREHIKQIYYERDKNSAHIDEDYRSTYYQSFKQLINEMKRQLNSVYVECRNSLPDEITIDYFPHDKVLFRLINKVDSVYEDEINKTKYVDHKEGYATGNLMKPRQVVYDIKELRGLSEDKKKELAVLVEAGLNFYEAQQNLQDFYILVNEIHQLHLWTYNVPNRINVYKKLKETGIIDQFDRPKKICLLTQKAINNAYNMANYIWGYGIWDKK